MPGQQDHFIQKQVLEVEISHEPDAFAFRNRLSGLYHDKLLPKMELIFDEVCAADQLIETGRIEIDLGHIGREYWEEELVAQTLVQLKSKLLSLGKKRIAGREDEAVEIFFYYLRNGRIPWNKQNHTAEELEALVLVNNKFISRLAKAIQQSNVLERLVYRFSEKFCNEIIIMLAADRKEMIGKIYSYLNSIPARPAIPIIQSSLIKVLSEERSNEEAIIIAQLSECIGSPLKKDISNSGIRKEDESTGPEPGEAIYINNSGLVLLHPFLPELFDHLQFVKDDQWADPDLKHLAVVTLEFMVNGAEDFEESGLSLNKLLCGMETDEVLHPVDQIPQSIKLACEELLAEVTKHWNILKNTGIATLQETFIHRSGKLLKVENGWLLQVEQQGVDILLNNLPWGIGVVKLPWMKDCIYVEWV